MIFPATPPTKLPIDLYWVDTPKGTWLIAVDAITKTDSGKNLLAKTILERRIDDERFAMRQLGMSIAVRDARSPEFVTNVAKKIGEWIDVTDGDGFIDLTGALANAGSPLPLTGWPLLTANWVL